ncbi:hypothetical protein IKG60_02090 [Candidatus Saccharibacteria bacterium]|nr:hypothetical protein [Candidatus Saccharibacteria bacterium]
MAELEALFSNIQQISQNLATFSANTADINRLGGSLKIAKKLKTRPLEYLQKLPEGKITLGISDYSCGSSRKSVTLEALKLKKILVRHGRSARVVESKDAVLSTATSLHNGLSGKNQRKVEFIKTDDGWYRVIGVQDIDAYARRDQARPARDAKVGMLPPKLAQILINLCGPLKPGAVVLDPFCGTGVVLQEAILMRYRAYGTDASERMIGYSKRNLEWLVRDRPRLTRSGMSEQVAKQLFQVSVGDATSFQWTQPVDAVACEGYLGKPFSHVPTEMELKEQKQECSSIVLGFLKNLAGQVKKGTPVVVAVPAWLRENGAYERLDILDYIEDMGYNVSNKSREGLLYHREEQIVARDIIILRKK